MKKKNLIFTIIAIVAVILMIVAVAIDNGASLTLGVIGSTVLFVLAILKWIVPSKKNTLLKIVGLLATYMLILTWVIPAASASGGSIVNVQRYRMSLYSLFEYPYLAFQYFLQPLLFILAVGGFYGVLAETGKYRDLLEKIAKKLKGKEKYFLVACAFILAVFSSVFGLNLMLFVFIPFLVAIILLLGYDKMTAFLVAFVAPIIGMIGSTYGYYVTGYINDVVGITYATNIVAKVGLFVLSFIVYAIFMMKHATKSKNVVNELTEKAELSLLGTSKSAKKHVWPIIVVMALILVLLVLGYVNWQKIFSVKVFADLDTTLRSWTINDHAILDYLLGDASAFGSWYFEQVTILLVFASIILSLIYRINIDDAIKAFTRGIKNVLKAGCVLVLAYTIVIITAYHPFLVNITDFMIGLVKGIEGVGGELLRALMISLNTILSSVLNLDMIYVVQATLGFVNSSLPEMTNTIAIITQSFYGLTMLVAPTSVIMILGLQYLGIPYKEWLKKAWKMLLALLAVAILVVIVVMYIL